MTYMVNQPSPIFAISDTDLANLVAPDGMTATHLQDGTIIIRTGGVWVPASSGGGSSVPAQLVNFTKANSSRLAAAVGKAISKNARVRLTFIGDSFSAGYTAGGTDNLLGARSFAFPAQLAKLLNQIGVNARADWAMGDGGITQTGEGGIEVLPEYDPRITINGSGIALLTGFNGFGGSMWQLSNAGDNYIFTPGTPFDTVEIMAAFSSTPGLQGNFTVAFDGGATAYTVANIADWAPHHLTFAVPGGGTANSVKIGQGSGLAFIEGVGTRLSTAPGIEIVNCGISGVEVATLALPATTVGDSNSWNTMASIPVLLDNLATNISFVNGWFNDENAGRTVSQVQADLTTLFNALLPHGDVIYLTYAPLSTDSISQALQDQYTAGAIAAAEAVGIPVMDFRQILQLFAVNNPLGLYGDNLHLNGAGHALAANILKSMFEYFA